jgi:DNA excision repair protein ERCC-4
MQPDYVILFNVNISAIRQIEISEARLQRKRKLTVFVLMHGKTVEEQSFLTSLRREKRAFEFLIESKRTMVIPEYQDGKTDVNDFEGEEQLEVNTRQAGGQEVQVKKEKPRIVVDSREFRSELPCLIHKRGIEVVPAMITIGDYILTPDICVERKSVSDLIGSLQCGRLYNQCQQMTRFYTKSILLIEFDQNRPFHLQGRYMLSRDSEVNSNEIMQKLQLLTIHFPKLRLVWSPSPYATAQLFEELKLNKEQPNLEKVNQIDPDDPLNELGIVTDKYNTAVYDFLLKLPGITSKNIHSVMKKGKSLKNLVKLSESELNEILGNSKDAKLLHDILHKVHKPTKQEPVKSAFTKKFARKY